MRPIFALLLAGLLVFPAKAQDRAIVDASVPIAQAVTIYRDPNRGTGDRMQRDWPRGFAMISETRQVILPPGQSTIRFTGVAEGMVAVSAIVSGLPGGTIEQNRNADLLSPAALVDGTLGNRVRVTRTNPATGEEIEETAVIRTRADGGLVLQSDAGYEAVRCAGLPERLSFEAVPAGLSSEPVFSIDTRDETGGTYTVTLSYLSWGFDWEANYVATFREGGGADGEVRFDLASWLTVLNDNNQSFEDATLLVVAGRLNVVSDFEGLATPPEARPLGLTCFPIGSTAAGTPYYDYGTAIPGSMALPSPPPPPMMLRGMAFLDGAGDGQEIMVTANRAVEENLGDLKLYRVPQTVTVAAQGLKQVSFLDRQNVEGRLLYSLRCTDWEQTSNPAPARMLLETVNDAEHGLGIALPTGQVAMFEPGPVGDMLFAEETIRDYASGQDVEIGIGPSTQVFGTCENFDFRQRGNVEWQLMRTSITNANPNPVVMRLELGSPAEWQLGGLRTQLKNGQRILEITIPANGTRVVEWEVSELNE